MRMLCLNLKRSYQSCKKIRKIGMSSHKNVITGRMHAVVRRLGLPVIVKGERVMLTEILLLVDLALCWQSRYWLESYTIGS